jgi:HEPN domain-containing protein
MKPLTLEWIDKAEGDFATSSRELRARKSPNYDAACFHTQQMAEKYLKAILQENGQLIPRTHSLIDLLAQCMTVDPNLIVLRSDLLRLDRYAVLFRYPGDKADRTEAKLAFRSASAVREYLKSRFGF